MSDCIVTPGEGEYVTQKVGGRVVRSHRHVYEERNGPIPPGLIVHHTCGEKRCLNPDHLELMTRLKHNRLHLRVDECRHGHPWVEENLYVDKNGREQCATCSRERQARYQQRLKA